MKIVVSSAYAVNLILLSKIFNPQIFTLDRTIMNKTSIVKANRNAERGSPCLVPLSKLKYPMQWSFPNMIWRCQPPLGFQIALEHLLEKIYITITDVVGEKRINLAYPIQNLYSSKEVTVISMFGNNVQYQIVEPLKVLPITNEERQLPEWVFIFREINTSIVRKLITTSLDANDNIIKMISWHASQRWFLAWTNSTTLTTWKMEDSAMSYLGIL